MDALVLPPQQQLARHHYWHDSASKMAGFLSPLPSPTRSRRRSTSRASSNNIHRSSDLETRIHVSSIPFRDAETLLSVDRPQGVLPPPPGDRFLESFTNGPASPISKPSSSSVSAVSPVTISAGNMSFLKLSQHGHACVGDSAMKNLRPVFRSENEPMQRPGSASGRDFSRMTQGSAWSSVVSKAGDPYKEKDAALFGSSPRGTVRTAKSSPEQVVFTNGEVSVSNRNEVANKKIFKDKKMSRQKVVDRAFQKKALENMPMQVTILQRPATKEAALENLARFNGVPLSELREPNGALNAAKSENSSIKDCSVLGIKTSSSKFQHGLTGTHSSFKKKNEGMEDANLTFLNPDVNVVNESLPEESFTIKLPDSPPDHESRSTAVRNVANKSSAKVSYTTKLPGFLSPDISSTGFSRALWKSELLTEKWAGPCYTVSPPPSSLPIPKFRMQKQIGNAQDPEDLSPKKQVSVLPFYSSHALKPLEMNTEMATKDLRRILQLDFT